MSISDEVIGREELQWSPGPDTYVCAECVCDKALADVVKANLESEECDYCGNVGDEAIAAPLSAVTEHMAVCIATGWTDPVNELMYISREGGYQGNVLDAWEVFGEIGYEPKDAELWDDMFASFSDGHWCKVDYILMTPAQRMRHGWGAFVDAVKHERRFTFWSMGDPDGDPDFDHPDDLPVGDMLGELAGAVREAKLLCSLPESTAIWRVRVHDESEPLTVGSDFSSPPREKAVQSNRMSPAGIPMLYGSEDFRTACAETLDPGRVGQKRVSGGRFSPVRPLHVLDLHDMPEVPSFWEKGDSKYLETLIFLHQFERELSKPIERGRIEHIEYVPTQAFSEYVRYQMKTDDGHAIDGIRYRSSKSGKACYVIFCEQEQCIEPVSEYGPEQILRFEPASLRSEYAEKG